MKFYNDIIKYNQPLVTYNGIVIVISEELVVNSETVSTLELVNIPAFGTSTTDLFNIAAYALSSLKDDPYSIGNASITIDKDGAHAVIDMNNGADFGPAGSLSITIISNV
jgi:hypothetical protein